MGWMNEATCAMSSASAAIVPQIMGGMFALPNIVAQERPLPGFLMGDIAYFVSARSALKCLFANLRPVCVWMPSYLCGSMLESLDGVGARLEFYPVDYDLKVVPGDWIGLLGKRDLVVLIDYFGFPLESEIAELIRGRDAVLVEDASQALLSTHVGKHADFVVYSPRKFLGVPDGGILANNTRCKIDVGELDSPPVGWWFKALEASLLRREFDRYGGDHRWFQLFREIEDTFPVGRYRASEFSKLLLKHAFNYEAMAKKRRANFEYLLSCLKDVALFGRLDDETVPMGFPIRVECRDELRQYLFDRHIYPPVHWPVEGVVSVGFEASHRLSHRIMTLVCDQRYDEPDLDIMAACVRHHLEQ